MMDINEHQVQRYTRGDNNGRDLYLLGVNVLVVEKYVVHRSTESHPKRKTQSALEDARIRFCIGSYGPWALTSYSINENGLFSSCSIWQSISVPALYVRVYK